MYVNSYDAAPYPEHQEELLIQGKFAPPPTSVAHLADHVEASGAKIEETLQRLNCTHSTLFFISGWIVIVVALYTLVASIFSLSLVGLIESIFLLVFGFIMMVLDIPGAPRWAARYRILFFRQIKFLTRLTGKSLWMAYLGCMVLVCLWPPPGKSSGFMLLFSFLLSSFVLSVAVIGFFIGIRKSLRLEKIRKQMLSAYRGNISEVYAKYAITDASHGLQFDEFNRLCGEYSHERCIWSTADLSLIYHALDDHHKGGINEKEFSEWVGGSMTYL